MTSKELLRFHLALILAQYGDKAVLEGLSLLLNASPMDLRAKLVEFETNGAVKGKSRPRSANSAETVQALINSAPEKADLLREFQERFFNRTFLPELRDVRRFLDRHGELASSLSKRETSFAKIARHLVKMSENDLKLLLAAPVAPEQSSLGVISDQILGSNDLK